MTHSFKQALLDSNGNPITSANPLPTTQQLKVETVIEDVAYDLEFPNTAYSETATPSYDYIIDNVTFEFSSAESRNITITSDNGTKIYESLANTSLSVGVGSINFGQAAGQSFTIAITQTVGACTVDVTANIKNSPVALTADPVLATGTNSIGFVGIKDSENREVFIDSSNSLTTIELEHHFAHLGKHFICSYFETINNGSTIDMILTAPDISTHSHMVFRVSGVLDTDVYFYEDCTHTASSTEYPCINNNRNSSTVATLSINGSNDNGSDGNLIFSTGFGISTGGGSHTITSGGEVRGDSEFILKQNTKYLFRVNSNSDNNKIKIIFTWYEIDLV